MRLKKVYIKNFKGIKEKKIIDFSNQTTLLVGPNGFGKTTIFDVIELCITGSIYRTSEKSKVTSNRRDYMKPFFQNNTKSDVTVKLWLENNKGEDLIIVKHLEEKESERSTSTGKKNKPNDFSFLKTFRGKEENFDQTEFDKQSHEVLREQTIDEFFGFGEEDYEVKEIYKMFNYLQQEETTFFLKKSEIERKNALSFLFQTDKQEQKNREIDNYISELLSIQTFLREKISQLKSEENEERVSFRSLFPTKSLKFDQQELYVNMTIEEASSQSNKFKQEISELERFIESFSPIEFEKKQKHSKYHSILESKDFLKSIVLKNFIEEANYNHILRKFDYLDGNNEFLLKKFILQEHLSRVEEYEHAYNLYKKYSTYHSLLNEIDYSRLQDNIIQIVEDLLPNRLEEFRELLLQYRNVTKSSSDIAIAIAELQGYREKIQKHLEKSTCDAVDVKQCPYCGTTWGSPEELDKYFIRHGKLLSQLADNQSDALEKINKEIQEKFIITLENEISEYLSNHKRIDSDLLRELKIARSREETEYILSNYGESLSSIIWTSFSDKNLSDLSKSVWHIKEEITKTMPISLNEVKKIKQIKNLSFENELTFIESELHFSEWDDYSLQFDTKKQITDLDVNEMYTMLKSKLDSFSEAMTYESLKADDSNNSYSRYFDNDRTKFNQLTKENLIEKRKYLKQELDNKQKTTLKTFEERDRKLDSIILEAKKVKNIYKQVITTHKREMANAIKLPFYVFTAKILQNYQQGMGIFLHTSDTTDSIRFLTDNTSDHDAMHHLSSGQLAVVSLAFTMAINATYNISENLKFLVIDDPIQDMDSLNIHSFIELMRHGFVEDYQLVLSTHNDLSALFIKYKFERMPIEDVKMINVQTEFFSD